jgi:hypothetical protein
MSAYDQQQQLLADQLRKYQAQAQTQAPQGRMAGRVYVAPNALEYLAAGLRGVDGMRGEQQTQQAMTDLQAKRQKEMAELLAGFSKDMQGTPYNPGTPGLEEFGRASIPEQAAMPSDPMAAFGRLSASQFPEFQKMGMQGQVSTAQAQQQRAQLLADEERKRALALEDAERQRALKAQEQQRMIGILQQTQGNPQAAIAAGVPPEVVKSFYESPNFGREEVKFEDVGGQKVPVTKYGTAPQGIAPLPKTAGPANAATDLLIPDPANPGKFIVNQPLVDVKGKIAEKGAARISNTVKMPDKKFYEGLGSSVSDSVAAAHKEAVSAAQSLGNANQMAQTLDKAFIGPLANQRLTLARIGSMLGVSGKNDNEKLVATRNLMQGLARQELAAAGQMKGQGQITESERAILRKAEAGEIQDFSKPELETFISAIRKTSRARIAVHESNLKKLGADPQAQGIVDFLRVEVPQDVGATPAQGITIRRLP